MVPYAPFSRSDKLGRASDWMMGSSTGGGGDRGDRYGDRDGGGDRGGGNRFGNSRFNQDKFGGGQRGNDKYGSRGANASDSQGGGGQHAPLFSYFAGDEEESFQLVENKPAVRPKFGGRQRYQQHRVQRKEVEVAKGRDQGAGIERERARQAQKLRKNQQWHSFTYRQAENARVTLACSIDIRPEWVVVEQYTLPQLNKLAIKGPFTPETLYECGRVMPFNKRFDRVTPKITVDLHPAKSAPLLTGADADPVLTRLTSEKKGFVYTTDAVLATLVCASRSSYSWDLIVHHRGDHIIIDRRDGVGNERLTVNETAQEPIPDDRDNMNGVQQLSAEATGIERSFMEQCLDMSGTPTVIGKDGDNPHETSGLLPQGYRYRRWKIDDSTSVVVRCSLDATVQSRGQELMSTVRVLNEFDSRLQGGLDYRKMIENQRGAVLATEIKNNAFKIARWACCALLAGTEQIKLGFAARTHPKDPRNHVLVATQGYKPKDFAAQINLKEENFLGVLKTFVDVLRPLKEGKYLFVKDPAKPVLRLYAVPAESEVAFS